MNRKYIVITGGVLSSLGKGIDSVSIGMLLSSRYKVVLIKYDVIISHAHDIAGSDCWYSIKDLIEKNKNIRFYLFTINHVEDIKFFGGGNVKYLVRESIQDFFENPLDYLMK